MESEIGMWKGRILGKDLVGLGELGIYPGQLIDGGGNTQAGDMRGQELLEQGVRQNVSFGLPVHCFGTRIIIIGGLSSWDVGKPRRGGGVAMNAAIQPLHFFTGKGHAPMNASYLEDDGGITTLINVSKSRY